MSKIDLFDWNDKQIARLRELWASGLSASRIGLELGAGKSAVIGKAHRLNLPARPSPIRGERGAGAARPVRVGRTAGKWGTGARIGPPEPPPASLPEFAAARRDVVPEVAPVVRRGDGAGCCWPLWGNREPPPRPAMFCGAARAEGRQYCAAHAAVAFVKVAA